MTDARYDEGMRVRREVLGDDRVDRATAATTSISEGFLWEMVVVDNSLNKDVPIGGQLEPTNP